ncbi:hypothetical protein HN51_045287 [Arachis hypogaea]
MKEGENPNSHTCKVAIHNLQPSLCLSLNSSPPSNLSLSPSLNHARSHHQHHRPPPTATSHPLNPSPLRRYLPPLSSSPSPSSSSSLRLRRSSPLRRRVTG